MLPQCGKMLLKSLIQESIILERKKHATDYPQSLPFETIRIEKLAIAAHWNILGYFTCRVVIAIDTNNGIKDMNCIRYSPTNWPVPTTVL